jgi:hypothetical protein
LESILNEFGDDVANDMKWIEALEKACKWCEDNRQFYYFEHKDYSGWNSGQQIDSLARGEPESWATGVVHMFLHQLRVVLSDCIERRLLQKYRLGETNKQWDAVLDCFVELPINKRKRAKKIIEDEIITPLEGRTSDAIRKAPLATRRSVLLFGPPGTSKTTLVRTFAKKSDGSVSKSCRPTS